MIQSRWSKMLGILPLVGALAGLSGCDNREVDSESAETAAAELEAAPEKDAKHPKMHGKHGRHGPAFLLGAALKKLDLTDAQRATIEAEMKALREAAGDRAEWREGREAHQKALAAAVRSGKVDEAALLAQMKKDMPAPDTARLAKAVQTLHDTLTPAQRKELVAAVSAKMEKMGKHAWKGGPDGERGHEGKRGGKGERGHDGKWGGKGKRGHDGKWADGEHAMRGPLGHLLRGVELTDAQREKVREALAKTAPSEADRAAMKARHEAFRDAMKERLETFAQDRFDANAFVAMPKDAAKEGPEAMAAPVVKALAAVVPVLDATQREALAKRIEEGPMKGMHGRMHKGHGRGHAGAE